MTRPLETGWLADTPVGDTVLRRFAFNQADVNERFASAAGGRSERDDDMSLADSGGPIAYYNQALAFRPLTGADDPILDRAEAFFAAGSQPATLLTSSSPNSSRTAGPYPTPIGNWSSRT